MRTLTLFICLLISLASCNKSEFEFEGSTCFRILNSTVVDDNFKIYFYEPANYDPNRQYPVIFLMDGDWYFTDFAHELSDLIQGGEVGSAIIVGIGYEEEVEEKRFRDYTFPVDVDYDITTGEADKFSQFLQEELIPYVELYYSTDTNNYVLMGHSLGGFNTLYNMLQPSPFDAYVAVSSSIWWKDAYLFEREEQFSNQASSLPVRAYISVGGDEPPSMTILNQELIERIESRNYQGLMLESEVFKGASHSQVPMAGFREGIQFVLD